MQQKIRVGIVDDSPLIRKIIKDAIESDERMCVVGQAGDPYEARAMIKDVNPDVITLDVEMPRMDGVSFLEKIMRLRPMPVIMVSTLTQRGADITLQALELGAVDYVAKPVGVNVGGQSYDFFKGNLLPKLRAIEHVKCSDAQRFSSVSAPIDGAAKKMPVSHYDCIAIASSTGGVERLRYLFSNIKCHVPPVVIVQHINRQYVDNMVSRLNMVVPSHLHVKLAEHREVLKKNTIYFANNRRHFQVKDKGGVLTVDLRDAPSRNGFIASADYLFESFAQTDVKHRLGMILSGMGNDGAAGLLALRKAGAYTLAENEASCLVYGMPRAAQEQGSVCKEMSLERLLHHINSTVV